MMSSYNILYCVEDDFAFWAGRRVAREQLDRAERDFGHQLCRLRAVRGRLHVGATPACAPTMFGPPIVRDIVAAVDDGPPEPPPTLRSFFEHPLIEISIRQTVPCRAIRGKSILVSSTLPPSYHLDALEDIILIIIMIVIISIIIMLLMIAHINQTTTTTTTTTTANSNNNNFS